jgi:predicted TIM-barrel fold metal-dependent hydrolase
MSEYRDKDPRGFSRRRFLAGLAAAGAAAVVPIRGQAPAGAGPSNGRLLDVHQHFGAPTWIKKNVEGKGAGFQVMETWTPAKAIEGMDKMGVATSMLSCTTPGVWWGDDFKVQRDGAIALAREMNEYGAKLVADYKGRFGLFAVLPLPDIDASLKEIAYAFDTLKADGVGLVTNYANQYLGEPLFQPVLEELNRRNAVVFSHPTDGPCCHSIGGQPPGTIEYFTDTARAILSLIVEGPGPAGSRAPSAATRFPNIQYIWSHAGGSLVAVSARVVGTVSADDLAQPAPPDSRLHHVRRFYYDTAAAANPVVMAGLTKLLGGTSQIVFGTDYPFGNFANIVRGLTTLGFTEQELRGIHRENALRILPKYRA